MPLPFAAIVFFGVVLLGTRIAEAFFPAFATEMVHKLSTWWQHRFRERKRLQTSPEPELPNSRGRPALRRTRNPPLSDNFVDASTLAPEAVEAGSSEVETPIPFSTPPSADLP